jgi:hypothetical protein
MPKARGKSAKNTYLHRFQTRMELVIGLLNIELSWKSKNFRNWSGHQKNGMKIS